MATIEFDVDAFRAQFPGLFPDPPNTDAFIEVFWGAAICYVSDSTTGSLSEDCRRQVLNLVTAHLIMLMESSAAGNQGGFITSGSIDKISVSILAPDSKSAFQFFLNQTQFGIQAYAMLFAAGVGGFYGGGFNELGSFRRAGGAFVPPSAPASAIAASICPSLVVAPLAPYTLDFGIIAPAGNNTQSVSILPPCIVFSGSFSSPGNAITLSLWSGSATDTGARFNIYFWSGDDRAASNPATEVSLSVNPTGVAIGNGFVLSGLVAGAGVNDPNLVVITGVDQTSSQVLNLDIAAA